MLEHIPTDTAEDLRKQVQQFRDCSHPSSPADDVNALLALFPRVNTTKRLHPRLHGGDFHRRRRAPHPSLRQARRRRLLDAFS
ncbi:MAG TPA: hypothetical protein QF604_08960 [Candidatus Latescibacteria bacterium]|nr:hypothetical protein [Candidatus Latescibacterota bacterium]